MGATGGSRARPRPFRHAALPAAPLRYAAASWCVLIKAVPSLRVRVPSWQAPVHHVAGSRRRPRGCRPSGASKARSGDIPPKRGAKPRAQCESVKPCSPVTREPERESWPSRSCRGEGNRLQRRKRGRSESPRAAKGSPLTGRARCRTAPGYGGEHAATVRHGTGESLLDSPRRAKTRSRGRVRSDLVSRGSPRGP